MINFLNNDVLDVILQLSQSYFCILVCKNWKDIILKKSTVCSECNKVTTLYGTNQDLYMNNLILWKSVDAAHCHTKSVYNPVIQVCLFNSMEFKKTVGFLNKTCAYVIITFEFGSEMKIEGCDCISESKVSCKHDSSYCANDTNYSKIFCVGDVIRKKRVQIMQRPTLLCKTLLEVKKKDTLTLIYKETCNNKNSLSILYSSENHKLKT